MKYELHMIISHSRTPYDVDWCHKTGLIATACGDNAIRIFRASSTSSDAEEESYELACQVEEAHSQDVNCVAWNPARPGTLVSCCDAGEIKTWKVVAEDDDMLMVES